MVRFISTCLSHWSAPDALYFAMKTLLSVVALPLASVLVRFVVGPPRPKSTVPEKRPARYRFPAASMITGPPC